MAKRETSETMVSQSEEIFAKITELDTLVAQFFSQFEKTTAGLQSAGETSLPFLESCVSKLGVYPEILSGTFNKNDFSIKVRALKDYFSFSKKILEALSNWDAEAKICKTDGMYYGNEYYNIIQKEAARNTKYKPTGTKKAV